MSHALLSCRVPLFLAPLLALSCPYSHAAALEQTPLARATATAGAARLHTLSAEETGVRTANVFNDPRMWGARFRELTLGAVETGIAIADFNQDGKLDIFSVSKNGPCSLFEQTSPWKFEDVAGRAGVTAVFENQLPSNTGVSVIDINQDGRPDLYLCRYDLPNLLYVNNGNGTFTEAAAAYGLNIKDASVHATWADYDRDGHVDMYLVTNILDFSKAPQGRRDYLFHNERNGTFKDVSKEAGIWGLTQGHTALWSDLNQDGWPDIYVANDFETPDRFYINRGNGTFTDVIDERLPHVTYFSMGADAGDLNNDGLIDLFITDMRDRNHREYMAGMEEISRGLWEQERVSRLIPQYMWNAVYINSGNDRFLEAAHLTGLEATGWTWSARLVDLDNDGKLDAFVTAGMVRNFIDADLVDKQRVAPDLNARARVWENSAERKEVPLVYQNRGQLEFKDVSAEWGMTVPTVAFGCAVADLDGDGDLDLVYSNYQAPPTLVRNESTDGSRLTLKLRGRAPNLDALGAQVTIKTKSGTQLRQVYTERGIAASEPSDLHFGLGDTDKIELLTVTWPNGSMDSYREVATNQHLVITQGDSPAAITPALFHAAPSTSRLVEEVQDTGLSYTHQLKPYDELSRQRLLPRRLHAQSPALASADVNLDGIPDVFVSGTAGQSGRLFLGQKDGKFVASPSQPWEAESACSDVGALFVDFNGDRAPDLFLAASGVDVARGNVLLNDRLYLNDGKGNFALAPEALPADGEATKAVAAGDFDGDGHLDLFVGGRSVANAYPESPRSFLYHWENGRWVDATDKLAPELRRIGMVTSASWADLDGDKRADLILSTEWGPVRVFQWQKDKLTETTETWGLHGVTGWWNSVTVADLDGDGRLDVAAGNVGLNTKYRASAAEPVSLLSGDLDANGKTQLIEAQYEDGKQVPLRGRSKLAYAYPWLPKKITTYRAFGEASLEDIFGAERLARASVLQATELRSGMFLQKQAGKFTFVPFAREVQMAPIQALQTTDLNGDGKLDLVVIGNHFYPEPTTGRFDGAQGWILLGEGKGAFRTLWPGESGFAVPYDGRSLLVLKNPANSRPRILSAEIERAVRIFDSK